MESSISIAFNFKLVKCEQVQYCSKYFNWILYHIRLKFYKNNLKYFLVTWKIPKIEFLQKISELFTLNIVHTYICTYVTLQLHMRLTPFNVLSIQSHFQNFLSPPYISTINAFIVKSFFGNTFSLLTSWALRRTKKLYMYVCTYVPTFIYNIYKCNILFMPYSVLYFVALLCFQYLVFRSHMNNRYP